MARGDSFAFRAADNGRNQLSAERFRCSVQPPPPLNRRINRDDPFLCLVNNINLVNSVVRIFRVNRNSIAPSYSASQLRDQRFERDIKLVI